MVDKRMLIVPAELVRKIDENRGDMSHSSMSPRTNSMFLRRM